MATDKTQQTKFPESCPSFNSASMYMYIKLSYQLWDEPHNQLAESIPHFRPLLTSKMSLQINMADLTFHQFKALIYSYMEENRSDWEQIHKLMKTADKLHQLKWRCTIPGHSQFGANQNFCATDDTLFQRFATSAGFHHGGGTPSVEIIMQEPNDVELGKSPPVAGLASPLMINMQTPPETYLVADSKDHSASRGSLVAVAMEAKKSGQFNHQDAPSVDQVNEQKVPFVDEQPNAIVTNQARKLPKAKFICFNTRQSKNARKNSHISTGASLIATATMSQNTNNPLPLPSAHQAPQDQTGAAINAPQDVTEDVPAGSSLNPSPVVTPRQSVSDQAPIPVITPSRIILDTNDKIPPAQPCQQLSQEQAQLNNHHGNLDAFIQPPPPVNLPGGGDVNLPPMVAHLTHQAPPPLPRIPPAVPIPTLQSTTRGDALLQSLLASARLSPTDLQLARQLFQAPPETQWRLQVVMWMLPRSASHAGSTALGTQTLVTQSTVSNHVYGTLIQSRV
ncbi:hypothetical protein PCANC_04060 [Puccinia coronata f. sp. avenae]|uniref:Uncharacterized protein n=1 Tax=Puccinia coronata f. sp. avenae TaxID=200324 RepID=A0A2N5W256_9BASI|nr:hypothetical protein PCANC_04060 [Puccinia coronata f. sp. avenae]